MAFMGGQDQLQQAEMSRQATLLGMQYGQQAGANASHQQAMLNQQQANASANQMMSNTFSSLASADWGSM